MFEAIAIGDPGQPPTRDHIAITLLDANHNPLPAGSGATPAFVLFEGLTGHFWIKGRFLHWGLSEIGLDTLRRAHATLSVTAVQNEYSMLSRAA